MYYLLTERFKEQEQKIVEIIISATPAEQIYVLGSSLLSRRTESVFTPSAPTSQSVSHYYLLILTSDIESSNSSIQDKIENNCLSFIPVTAIIYRIDDFRNLIEAKNSFTQAILEKAVKIYDAGNIEFSTFRLELSPINSQNNCGYFDRNKSLVEEFLAGAELYKVRKQYNMAAFMLHQSIEHSLHAILKSLTGLHVNTHNLDKLLRYCSMVNHKIPDIFPRNNEHNERLFQIIQKAYINTRYKESSTITGKDLSVLIERARSIEEIMRELLACFNFAI